MARSAWPAVLLLAAVPASAHRACLSDNPDVAIRACTVEIVSPPDPRDVASSYFSRGNAYLKKGQRDQAISDFEKAIAIDPDSPRAYGSVGVVYYSMGRYDLAIDDLTRAIELSGSQVAPIDFLRRGVAYEASGERDKAIADYQAALRLDPNDQESSKGLKRLRAVPP